MRTRVRVDASRLAGLGQGAACARGHKQASELACTQVPHMKCTCVCMCANTYGGLPTCRAW